MKLRLVDPPDAPLPDWMPLSVTLSAQVGDWVGASFPMEMRRDNVRTDEDVQSLLWAFRKAASAIGTTDPEWDRGERQRAAYGALLERRKAAGERVHPAEWGDLEGTRWIRAGSLQIRVSSDGATVMTVADDGTIRLFRNPEVLS